MSKKNFIQKCLDGEILSIDIQDEFDDAVDSWHEHKKTQELHEFLGLSLEEYELIIEKPESLKIVIFLHENRLSLNQSAPFLTGDKLAARGCDSQTGLEILKWLKKKGKI